MTDQELKNLDMTEEELSKMVVDLRQKLEGGQVKFSSNVMTPERIKKMTAIRSSNGIVDLDSIDIDTVMFIRAVLLPFRMK